MSAALPIAQKLREQHRLSDLFRTANDAAEVIETLYAALDQIVGSVGVDSCAYDTQRYSAAVAALGKARAEQVSA